MFTGNTWDCNSQTSGKLKKYYSFINIKNILDFNKSTVSRNKPPDATF